MKVSWSVTEALDNLWFFLCKALSFTLSARKALGTCKAHSLSDWLLITHSCIELSHLQHGVHIHDLQNNFWKREDGCGLLVSDPIPMALCPQHILLVSEVVWSLVAKVTRAPGVDLYLFIPIVIIASPSCGHLRTEYSIWYKPDVLEQSIQVQQNTKDQVTYKHRQLFVTIAPAESPRSGHQLDWVRAIFWVSDFLSPHMTESTRELYGVSFIRALISLRRGLPSYPNHLPKASSLGTFTLGFSFWHINRDRGKCAQIFRP